MPAIQISSKKEIFWHFCYPNLSQKWNFFAFSHQNLSQKGNAPAAGISHTQSSSQLCSDRQGIPQDIPVMGISHGCGTGGSPEGLGHSPSIHHFSGSKTTANGPRQWARRQYEGIWGPLQINKYNSQIPTRSIAIVVLLTNLTFIKTELQLLPDHHQCPRRVQGRGTRLHYPIDTLLLCGPDTLGQVLHYRATQTSDPVWILFGSPPTHHRSPQASRRQTPVG